MATFNNYNIFLVSEQTDGKLIIGLNGSTAGQTSALTWTNVNVKVYDSVTGSLATTVTTPTYTYDASTKNNFWMFPTGFDLYYGLYGLNGTLKISISATINGTTVTGNYWWKHQAYDHVVFVPSWCESCQTCVGYNETLLQYTYHTGASETNYGLSTPYAFPVTTTAVFTDFVAPTASFVNPPTTTVENTTYDFTYTHNMPAGVYVEPIINFIGTTSGEDVSVYDVDGFIISAPNHTFTVTPTLGGYPEGTEQYTISIKVLGVTLATTPTITITDVQPSTSVQFPGKLATSGSLSMGGISGNKSISYALGYRGTCASGAISLNNAEVRSFAGKYSGGAVVMPTDFYGKIGAGGYYYTLPGHYSFIPPTGIEYISAVAVGGGGAGGEFGTGQQIGDDGTNVRLGWGGSQSNFSVTYYSGYGDLQDGIPYASGNLRTSDGHGFVLFAGGGGGGGGLVWGSNLKVIPGTAITIKVGHGGRPRKTPDILSSGPYETLCTTTSYLGSYRRQESNDMPSQQQTDLTNPSTILTNGIRYHGYQYCIWGYHKYAGPCKMGKYGSGGDSYICVPNCNGSTKLTAYGGVGGTRMVNCMTDPDSNDHRLRLVKSPGGGFKAKVAWQCPPAIFGGSVGGAGGIPKGYSYRDGASYSAGNGVALSRSLAGGGGGAGGFNGISYNSCTTTEVEIPWGHNIPPTVCWSASGRCLNRSMEYSGCGGSGVYFHDAYCRAGVLTTKSAEIPEHTSGKDGALVTGGKYGSSYGGGGGGLAQAYDYSGAGGGGTSLFGWCLSNLYSIGTGGAQGIGGSVGGLTLCGSASGAATAGRNSTNSSTSNCAAARPNGGFPGGGGGGSRCLRNSGTSTTFIGGAYITPSTVIPCGPNMVTTPPKFTNPSSYAGWGGDGAVRIIWPGNARQFPANKTGKIDRDLTLTTTTNQYATAYSGIMTLGRYDKPFEYGIGATGTADYYYWGVSTNSTYPGFPYGVVTAPVYNNKVFGSLDNSAVTLAGITYNIVRLHSARVVYYDQQNSPAVLPQQFLFTLQLTGPASLYQDAISSITVFKMHKSLVGDDPVGSYATLATGGITAASKSDTLNAQTLFVDITKNVDRTYDNEQIEFTTEQISGSNLWLSTWKWKRTTIPATGVWPTKFTPYYPHSTSTWSGGGSSYTPEYKWYGINIGNKVKVQINAPYA